MKTRSRDVRSTRREVQAMKRLSNLMSLEQFEDEVLGGIDLWPEDAPFPLKDGTQADPRQAWVLPSNEQEK